MTCRRHAHSSPASALACYSRQVRLRLDRRLGRAPPEVRRYRQVVYRPAVVRIRGGVEVWIFCEGQS